MNFVGLDAHYHQSSYCMMNSQGQVVKQATVRGGHDQLIVELSKLSGPLAIGYEASCGYGTLHDRLVRLANVGSITVAHPGHLRLIFQAKRKNDRIDAQKLALLMYLDQMPAVHVPRIDVREWRRLIEYRRSLVAKQTRCKNQLRTWTRRHGLTAPRSLWTKTGLAWLGEQTLDSDAAMLERDLLLDELATLGQQLKRVTAHLDQRGQRHPGVILLQTIPGVGPRTAEAVTAYIDNPKRFGHSKKVGAYFGLTPTLDASAATHRLGHISREGPASVRQLLTEVTWQAKRKSPTVGAYFDRIAGGKKDRNKIAIVATAHYLLRCMYAMLRTGETWRERQAA
jgi:transposase